LAYLKYRPHENQVFNFITVPYTIIVLQAPKVFSAYLVEQNGAMWRTWISGPQNAKKDISWKI